MTGEDRRVIYGCEDIGLVANAPPSGISFHHAFHDSKISACFNVAVLEEAIANDDFTFLRVNGNRHRRTMMHAGPEDTQSRLYFLFVCQKAQLLPAFILNVLIYVWRNSQMA